MTVASVAEDKMEVDVADGAGGTGDGGGVDDMVAMTTGGVGGPGKIRHDRRSKKRLLKVRAIFFCVYYVMTSTGLHPSLEIMKKRFLSYDMYEHLSQHALRCS